VICLTIVINRHSTVSLIGMENAMLVLTDSRSNSSSALSSDGNRKGIVYVKQRKYFRTKSRKRNKRVILLHFAWVVDDAKCILVTRVCVSVCLWLAAFPHYCTDPDVTREMVGVPPSCALLGGFAIGARVTLQWQHSANAKCQLVLVLALCRWWLVK